MYEYPVYPEASTQDALTALLILFIYLGIIGVCFLVLGLFLSLVKSKCIKLKEVIDKRKLK